MFRVLLTLAVIASLAWCPMRCLACAMPPLSTAGEKCAPKKCACCCHRVADEEKAKSKTSPAEPSDDCDCADCLCKGAVLGSAAPIDVAVAFAPLNLVATDALFAVEPSLIAVDHLEVPIRSVPSGREIVVLFGNLRR